ncbi:MAG: PAS domain S-box protein [Myxococcota bacterium]
MFEELPIAALVVDLTTGQVVFTNHHCRAFEGHPAIVAPSGQHEGWELVGLDGAPLTGEALPLTRLRQKESLKGAEVVLSKSGRRLLLLVSSAPLPATDGRALVAITFHDITALRQAELERDQLLVYIAQSAAELEDSERRFRFLADNVPPIVWAATASGRIDYVNQRFREYAGRGGDEALPKALIASVHPDDMERCRREWGRCIDRELAFELDLRLRRADGAYRWHLVRALPMRDERGSVTRWFGTCTDMHDHRRTLEENQRLVNQLASERERLEAVMRGIPVGVLIVEARLGAVTFANRQIDHILRDPVARSVSAAELCAHWQARRLDGAPYEPDDFPPARVLRQGETIMGEEVRVTRGDGSSGYLRINAAPIIEAAGAIIAAVVVCEDITDEKHTEEERRRLAHFREQFIGILGHDLRNPLNAVMIGADLLQLSGRGAKEQGDVAARIKNSAKRMQAMVEQILDLARSRLGEGIPVNARRMNLGELARQVVDEVETAHRHGAVRLTIKGDLEGEWDPDRLGQVISNLVTNAIKHGDAGAPIEVLLHADGGEVSIDVHNRGEPIPGELFDVLFEPYRPTPRGRGDGLGLGLFITKQIVLAHGGTIQVRSGLERTTFSVTLPRSCRQEGERTPQAASL